jgi:hypothetical protein
MSLHAKAMPLGGLGSHCQSTGVRSSESMPVPRNIQEKMQRFGGSKTSQVTTHRPDVHEQNDRDPYR